MKKRIKAMVEPRVIALKKETEGPHFIRLLVGFFIGVIILLVQLIHHLPL